MFKKIFILLIIVCAFFVSWQRAQELFSHEDVYLENEEIIKAKVVKIVDEENDLFQSREYVSQKLETIITSGSIKNRKVTVNSSRTPKYNNSKFKKGDELLIGYMKVGKSNETFYIISHSREKPLLVLFSIFVLFTTFIARKKGLHSLVGMTSSIAILILFVLPLIESGANPVYSSIGGILVMIPALFYISHGFNKKTTAAVIGTLFTLIITAIIAKIFVDWANLSGVVFEEVETLLYTKRGNIDLQGILLAGILMGALGVIDDVAMTQASIVEEIKKTNPKISLRELYTKAMNVGRDHIGSVINTLILVYVGGSLSTLLLFTQFPRPLIVLINSEVVAIPIVIALIGSIGLIIAIPTTTFLAAWLATNNANFILWKKVKR